MKVAEAAEIWEEAKRAIEPLEERLKTSGEIMKAYFRRTGKQDYKGRIGYAKTFPKHVNVKGLRADQPELVEKYEERRERETLSLLK